MGTSALQYWEEIAHETYGSVGGVVSCKEGQRGVAVWCLGGSGGMDPHSTPYIIPNDNPYNLLPHALLSTREVSVQYVLNLIWHHHKLVMTVARGL